MKKYTMPVIIEKDKDGYYVWNTRLCKTAAHRGPSARNLSQTSKTTQPCIKDRLAKGEKIKIPEMIRVTTLEVASL